jgi:hypothetical protein
MLIVPIIAINMYESSHPIDTSAVFDAFADSMKNGTQLSISALNGSMNSIILIFAHILYPASLIGVGIGLVVTGGALFASGFFLFKEK